MKVARILHVNGGGGSQRAKILRQVNHMIVAIEGIMLPLVAGVMNADRVPTKEMLATAPALQTRLAGLGITGMEEAPHPPQPAVRAPRANTQHRGMSAAALNVQKVATRDNT